MDRRLGRTFEASGVRNGRGIVIIEGGHGIEARIMLVPSLLDTPPEAGFDRVTRLAARMLDAPVAHVSVLDDARSFLKSQFGLPPEIADARQLPLTHSFCRHVAASDEALIVSDALGHALVGDNPVIADYGVRSYFGVPVRDGGDRLVCVLCVLDFRPREWTEAERAIMDDLVALLRTELELRAEVQERRRAEERTVLLMREMEHRLKNGLSTVQAIISMSLKGDAVPEALRRALLERVASLAQTHTLLLSSDWTATTFEALLDAELRHYAVGGRIQASGPAVRVGANEAVAVGMLIHELATNAAKYGALARAEEGEGRLEIDWHETRGASGERRLRLRWAETVAGAIAPPSGSSGFGTTLLEALIVRQQNGSIDRDWRPDGLTVIAEFDLPEP